MRTLDNLNSHSAGTTVPFFVVLVTTVTGWHGLAEPLEQVCFVQRMKRVRKNKSKKQNDC